MADASLADLYAAALAAAGTSGPSTILPKGPYRAQLAGKKDGLSKGNKPQIGLKWTILEGPYEGQSTWTNDTLTEGNPQALGIWLRLMIQLGVDETFIRSGQVPAAELPNYVVKGLIGVISLDTHAFGTDDTGNAKIHQDLKGVKLESVPAVTITPTGTPNIPSNPVPVVSVPVPQVAAPAPVQQVVYQQPVAQPVVQQPQVIVQPAPAVVVPIPPLPQVAVQAPAGTQVNF